MSPQQTDGKWLEELTVLVSPHIPDWEHTEAHQWSEWPEREDHFPTTTNQDVGIDVVARRNDGRYVAIQCKSRQLDDHGHGADINHDEIAKFASTSAGSFWAERWIVTNGGNETSGNIRQVLSMHDKPIKMVNIASALADQSQATPTQDNCPHCADPEDDQLTQTKSCMQREAVAESVRILREHERSGTGGLPPGQARGKIILPCGTGKTRISLRIAEELTPPGGLAIVLCPSIALVAQLRREYLQHTRTTIRALAVCSDETAGYDPNKEGKESASDNPTADVSNASASEVKGNVTTDPQEIAAWIQAGRDNPQLNVIFGTYQSGHRIAEALTETSTTADVLVADEAHRTAGIRRIRKLEEKIRDFTICHDNTRLPARYRIYQTATPRVYDLPKRQSQEWVVRTMDDEATFGVELYRKSYTQAVNNGWLADYRIIALGVNDPEAYRAANLLAQEAERDNARSLTTATFLKGLTLALAMSGGTSTPKGTDAGIDIKSCIAFMNTVEKSRTMARQLQSETVRNWVQKWLDENREGKQAANFALEHLDAKSNVTSRDNAKAQLGAATQEKPHGIINVGIFGEGTDAPSLSSVAFLEARKSPIDVVQAVGRAMRTAPEKDLGYIICPVRIPPNEDAERWLMTSGPNDGWQELGQILLALRAHDSRIEDKLADLLYLCLPEEPEEETTMVAIANQENGRIQYHAHLGAPGEAQKAVENVLEGRSKPSEVFVPVSRIAVAQVQDTGQPSQVNALSRPIPEPQQIMTGKNHEDGTQEIRLDSVARGKPAPDGVPGPFEITKSKTKAKRMINEGEGIKLPHSSKSKRTPKQASEANAARMLALSGLEENGSAIAANLLTKSGLSRNRVMRDLNILEASVSEATRHLREDELQSDLDRHFHLDNLNEDKRKSQADGCTIAALLMMNAAMLHQRIAAGKWLIRVSDLAEVKNSPNVVTATLRQWNTIIAHDFKPVMEPAVRAIEAIQDTGRPLGWNGPSATSPPRRSASQRPTPTWAPTTPALCSTGSWATRPQTAPTSPGPWRPPSPRGSPWTPAGTWTGQTPKHGKPTRRSTWPVAAGPCWPPCSQT